MTQNTASSEQQDPIRKDTLAANAFLIAMPGTPCVFYRHWIDCKQSIKAMIDARKLAGITNTSTFVNFRSSTKYLANTVTGSNGKLLVVVGDVASMTAPSTSTWTKILSGYHYALLSLKYIEYGLGRQGFGRIQRPVRCYALHSV